MRAKLTVIIPTLNAEATLPACLAALFEGIEVGLIRELLISDGGSSDATAQIADEVGAALLFDAAHQCGIIASGAWKNPLNEGAHLMTMSTYKSLGGPAGGLIVTNDTALAQALDAIAFPGMTANFDAAKSAALAVTLLDWRSHGHAYAAQLIPEPSTYALFIGFAALGLVWWRRRGHSPQA